MRALPKRTLSKLEQEALNREVQRQLEAHAEKASGYFDAMVLFTLHRMYGFGKKRLREFWENYTRAERELTQYYGTTPIGLNGQRETEFYVLTELKNIGVDVEWWRQKRNEWTPEEDLVWKEKQ